LSDYSDSDDDEAQRDPSHDWPEVHAAVISTIAELGGKVHPKLNWSAPKDATWMATTNSMECTSANDIYLLLKSSDFVTHDLEQTFDGCVSEDEEMKVPYHLVLRKSIPSVVTSMEFRCFVKDREIVGICQRELNHYEFLPSLIPLLQRLIGDFFEEKLRDKFPDPNFVFDVYIPQPKEKARVWLIDINPWAPRTDPLLFSWMELLSNVVQNGTDSAAADDEDVEDIPHYPEFRIVKRDDPEAYSFNSPLYSAHKLPKDVVDAGLGGGGGIREFLEKWNEIQAHAGAGVSDDDD
jgi:D123